MGWEADFWSKVDKSAGPKACWPWLGGHDGGGYGAYRVGSRTMKAHRLALELTFGGVPLPGLIVRHKCNCPPCCNPRHLELGDDYDNAQDRVKADRSACGEDNGRAKLTWAKVREMRAWATTGVTVSQLAREFHVSRKSVSKILDGRAWRDGKCSTGTRYSAQEGHSGPAQCR